MTTEAKKWLFDVREACAAIASFVAAKSLADYCASELLRAATKRKFEIVGEAMGKLREHAPNIFDRIKEGHEIIGFRNRLIHGYDSVDDAIVRDVVQHKLPKLRVEVEHLLAE
jgi:uncharacterized protein with HEPN domain